MDPRELPGWKSYSKLGSHGVRRRFGGQEREIDPVMETCLAFDREQKEVKRHNRLMEMERRAEEDIPPPVVVPEESFTHSFTTSFMVSHAVNQLLTPDSNEAISMSVKVARFYQQDLIRTGHILLGLVYEGRCNAVKVLLWAGLDITTLERQVKSRIPMGQIQRTRQSEIFFSPHAKMALELCLQISIECGSDVIEPQHILISLLSNPEFSSYRVIEDLGNPNIISEEAFRRARGGNDPAIPYRQLVQEIAGNDGVLGPHGLGGFDGVVDADGVGGDENDLGGLDGNVAIIDGIPDGFGGLNAAVAAGVEGAVGEGGETNDVEETFNHGLGNPSSLPKAFIAYFDAVVDADGLGGDEGGEGAVGEGAVGVATNDIE